MLAFLNHNEINKEQWDSLVENARFHTPYFFSWYLDIVSPGWKALVLIERNELIAAMPIPVRRKHSISYVYQPFFCQQLGIISLIETSDIEQEFYQTLFKKYKYVECQINEENEPPVTKGDTTKTLERTNYVLSLEKNYTTISSAYTSNRKRDLRKFSKSDLSVKSSENIDDLVDLYYEEKSSSIKGLKKEDYFLLKKLYFQGKKLNRAFLLSVYEEKTCLATCLFIQGKNRIIYLAGTSNEKGRKIGAMTAIFDQLIRNFAEQKISLDFEGSDIQGLQRFYSSFGADKRVYYRLKSNKLPWIVKLFKK